MSFQRADRMYREALVIGDCEANTAFAEVQASYRHTALTVTFLSG